MLQRLYRLKDAPKYLGIDKNVFNRDVRPELSEIRHGRAVLFHRAEPRRRGVLCKGPYEECELHLWALQINFPEANDSMT